MSMSRAQLSAELWGRLGAEFTAAGITNADTTGNLKEPLDSALLSMGVAYGDLATATVPDSDIQRAIAWAEYYGYDRLIAVGLRNSISTTMSVGAPSVSKSTNGDNYIKSLERQRDAARAKAEALSAGTAWVFGDLSLGIFDTSDGAL